jgi:hypothetical protein
VSPGGPKEPKEPYHEVPSRSDFGGGTSYDANGNRTSVVYILVE